MTATFGIAATHFPRSAIGAMNATSLIPWGDFEVYLKYLMIREITKSLDIDKKQLMFAILRHILIGYLFMQAIGVSISSSIYSFIPLLVPWFFDSSRHSFIACLFICLQNICTAIEDSICTFSSVYI